MSFNTLKSYIYSSNFYLSDDGIMYLKYYILYKVYLPCFCVSFVHIIKRKHIMIFYMPTETCKQTTHIQPWQ